MNQDITAKYLDSGNCWVSPVGAVSEPVVHIDAESKYSKARAPRYDRGCNKNFKLAELIFCETHISAVNTDKLMAIVVNLQYREPFFKDHSDLCHTIDASNLGDML